MGLRDFQTWLMMNRQPAGRGVLLDQPDPTKPQQKKEISAKDVSSSESGSTEFQKDLSSATIPNQDYASILNRVSEQDPYGKEQSGVDTLQQQWQDLKDLPYKTDLSALIPFADDRTAGLLSKLYKAPETQESREEKLTKLQELIQRRREGAEGSLIKAIRGQLIPQQVIGGSGLTDKDRLLLENAGKANSGTNPKGSGKGPDFTKDIQQYTDRLDKDNIPKLMSALSALKGVVPPSGRVPGFGGTSGIASSARELPGIFGGIARATTQRFPARENLAALANELARSNFGSRQTQTELQRLAKQMQDYALGDSDESANAFRSALGRFGDAMQKELANRQTVIMSKPGLADAYKKAASATGGSPILATDPTLTGGFTGEVVSNSSTKGPSKPIEQMSKDELKAYLGEK